MIDLFLIVFPRDLPMPHDTSFLHYSSDIVIWQIHFGESSMQKCEIMLNDLIDSKRTNSNIKTSLLKTSQTGTAQISQVPYKTKFNILQQHLYTSFLLAVPGQEEAEVSHDVLDATIISSNFWPPIQVCPKDVLMVVVLELNQ